MALGATPCFFHSSCAYAAWVPTRCPSTRKNWLIRTCSVCDQYKCQTMAGGLWWSSICSFSGFTHCKLLRPSHGLFLLCRFLLYLNLDCISWRWRTAQQWSKVPQAISIAAGNPVHHLFWWSLLSVDFTTPRLLQCYPLRCLRLRLCHTSVCWCMFILLQAAPAFAMQWKKQKHHIVIFHDFPPCSKNLLRDKTKSPCKD